MASVMNKFVHCPSADERRCALLCADEVDRQQQYQTAKDCHGKSSRRGMTGTGIGWAIEPIAD